jgi:hypothetical protein
MNTFRGIAFTRSYYVTQCICEKSYDKMSVDHVCMYRDMNELNDLHLSYRDILCALFGKIVVNQDM